MSLRESSSLTGRRNSSGVKGYHLVGHLSEMLNSAGKEKVDGESNVEQGNRPSEEMRDRPKRARGAVLCFMARGV